MPEVTDQRRETVIARESGVARQNVLRTDDTYTPVQTAGRRSWQRAVAAPLISQAISPFR